MSLLLVVPGETQLPFDVVLSRQGVGGITGKTITLEIRDGSSATSYLDFNDNAFKTSGWTTKTVNLVEIGTTGRYRYLLNSSLVSAMVDGFIAVAEFKLTGDATYSFISATTVIFRSESGVPAATIAAAVWDEIMSGHSVVGSFGVKVKTLLSGGDGSISVTHNTGGTDNMTCQTSGGVPIDNVLIRAYLKSDWDAGNRSEIYVKGYALTNVSGQWTLPMFLDAGTYTFVAEKQGAYGPDTKEQAVS